MAGAKFSQLYSNLPVFPGMPMPSAFDIARGSAFTPQPAQQFSKVPNYTQAELDMLLYGYGISKTSEGGHHALSGLRISELGMFTIAVLHMHFNVLDNHSYMKESIPRGIVSTYSDTLPDANIKNC